MPPTPRRRFQFRLRTLLIGVTLLAVVCAYVGSYLRLSRRGMRECKAVGMEGFLYIPLDEAAATHDLSTHYRLMIFYAPLNWCDREFFGGAEPIRGIMWSLTGSATKS